ncbi:MAG: ABC transporter permease [Vicinamibacterales bacterium]
MSAPWNWRRRSLRLARHLPPASAAEVLGDLTEEYRERLAHDGRVRSELWLAGQMWSISRAYSRYHRPRPVLWSRLPLAPGREWAQTLRSLLRTPWYTATAITVLALGTALGTSIFAIVDGTLFKPLPYPSSSRLFAVALGYSRLPDPLESMRPVSPTIVREWRAGAPDIMFSAFYVGNLQTVGRRDRVRNADVDPFFFDALGVRPIIGGFSPEDFGVQMSIRPAVVTWAFWRERFGDAAPSVGEVLSDDTGAGIRIVGVLPQTFVFPSVSRAAFQPVLLTPLVRDPADRGNSLRVLARLRPDADVRSASEHVNAMVMSVAAARSPQDLPQDLPPRTRIQREGYDRGGLEALDHALRSSSRDRAWVVFTAAGALVLLACFNVSGLAVARARDRRRDLVVRRALGAGTRDLVRLLALESVLIVTGGTAAGLLLAWQALPLGARLFAGDFMLTLKPAVIDVRVAVFAGMLAVCGSMIVILLAARAITGAGLQDGLSDGAWGTRRARRRLSMVSFEVAVAYLVTVTAALVVGSLIRVSNEDTGFDVPAAALLRMSAPSNASAADIEKLVMDIGRVAGVQAAGGVAHPLFEKAFNGSVFDSPPGVVESAGGRSAGPGGTAFPIESVPVTGGFFQAVGLAPREGRLPTDDEFRNGAPLIVITETVAREYWPGQRAVGQMLLNGGRPFEVIGVVNDTRLLSLDLAEQGEIFWPMAAMPKPYLSNVVVKLSPDAEAGIDGVAATVRARCHDCWVRHSLTFEEALAESIRPRQFSAWLFSGFGIAALVIVGTGILGVVAMTTTRRVREIGIRMALGATSRRVWTQLVGEQLASVAIGILMGAFAAWWGTAFMVSYLYETTPTDVIAWAGAAVAVLLVGTLGAFVPAHRASHIDPARALRVD